MKHITIIDVGNWTITSLFPFIGFIFFLDQEINTLAFNSLKGLKLNSFLYIILICGVSFMYDFFSIKYKKHSLSKLISRERKKKGFKDFKYSKGNSFDFGVVYKPKKIFCDLLRQRESYFNKLNYTPEVLILKNQENIIVKEVSKSYKNDEINLSENKLILSDNAIKKGFKKSFTLNNNNEDKEREIIPIPSSPNKKSELNSTNKSPNQFTENEKFIEKDKKINFRTEIQRKYFSLDPNENKIQSSMSLRK